MLSMILLQVAAGMSLAKVGAAIGAGLAAIGAGIGIGKIGANAHGRYCPPTRADREYSYEYDRDRCFD